MKRSIEMISHTDSSDEAEHNEHSRVMAESDDGVMLLLSLSTKRCTRKRPRPEAKTSEHVVVSDDEESVVEEVRSNTKVEHKNNRVAAPPARPLSMRPQLSRNTAGFVGLALRPPPALPNVAAGFVFPARR